MKHSLKTLSAAVLLLLAATALQAQSVNSKIKVGKEHYVVLSPGIDTIFCMIKEIAFDNGQLTKLKISSKQKSGYFSKLELREVVGYRLGNNMQEFAFVPGKRQKKEGRWLQVFNTGEVRLLSAIQNAIFEGEEEDVQVNYKMYYWRIGESVFPITESLLEEAILPSINACAQTNLVSLGSVEDKAYLLELTKYWNEYFDCITIIDLN